MSTSERFEPRISAHHIANYFAEVRGKLRESDHMRGFCDWVIDSVGHSQKFYLGELRDVADLKEYDPILANIPYPLTYFEFDTRYQFTEPDFHTMLKALPEEMEHCVSYHSIYVCWKPTDTESIARGVRFSFREGSHMAFRAEAGVSPISFFDSFVTEVSVIDNEIVVLTKPSKYSSRSTPMNPGLPEEMQWMARRILAVNALLRCKNIKTELVEPPKRLNDARRKARKVPFARYHVLTLSPERATIGGEATGRFHAAPCFHWRRGHIREYKPGMFTYISATTVGTPARGYVVKDYAVGGNSSE